jgi:hypothetical protein
LKKRQPSGGRRLKLDVVKKLVKGKVPKSEIAKRFGVTRQAVFQFCWRNGIA